LRNLGGQGCRSLAHLLLRHELIDQPHRLCLFAADAPAGVDHQRGMLRPDQARQSSGQAETGMEAEACEIGGEACLGAADAEIRHDGEAEAGTHSRTLHCGHDGLGGAPEADCFLIEMAPALDRIAPIRAAAGKIGAGREMLAFRAEHDRAA
jgi:hypothetical protein